MKKLLPPPAGSLLGALLLALFALASPGCVSYKLNGSALDYSKYKTLRISEFPIRAALVYPPLQQVFENRLMDQIQAQTRLSIVPGSDANVEMSGEITQYSLSPQAVGQDAYATQTRLTIGVHIKYTDHINPANDLDQTFSAYRDFSADLMLTDVQDELCQQISEELVDLIFNATLGNW